MAILYVRSTDGDNADDGSTWALAKATLAGAFTAAGAGDTIYVSQAHAETQASAMTLTSPGTAASPVKVICVNDSAAPPTALATTATVSTTGNSSISFGSQYTYVYGITFQSGSGGNATAINVLTAAPGWLRFEGCKLALISTGNGSLLFGTSGGTPIAARLDLINTILAFAGTGQTVNVRSAHVTWRATASALGGSAVPTTLLTPVASTFGEWVVEGVDLSAAGSGKNLVTVANAAVQRVLFRDCKLGASVAITTGTVSGPNGVRVEAINCDSADTNYRLFRQDVFATEQHETTIVRSGGASDGVTPVSREIVTTAAINAGAGQYYRSLPVEFWNTTVGSSVSLAVPIVTDNVTLTDAEAWIEVEYLGTSGFPLGLVASDRVTDPIFGTPANQATDGSSTWTTTGLGTPVQQTLGVSVTPQEIGLIRVYVCVAKASTTLYYDPKVLATSGRQYQGAAAYINEGAAGGGYTPLSHAGYTGIAVH